MAVEEEHPHREVKAETKVADSERVAFVYVHPVVTASLMKGE
jgi:hypothetical protein